MTRSWSQAARQHSNILPSSAARIERLGVARFVAGERHASALAPSADILTRPNLADRAMLLTLEPIAEELRRSEAELWAAFETDRPRILDVLLDAVVEGLRRLPEIHLPKPPLYQAELRPSAAT